MRIRKQHGVGRWRKMKGIADVRLQSGGIRKAELHWYEAHGIGLKLWDKITKIRYLCFAFNGWLSGLTCEVNN
jgi:hypothetical protein